MSDYVHQAMHPMIKEELEKLEAAHQVSMRELEDRMQDQIDDLQNNVDNAASSIDRQRSEVEELIPKRDPITGQIPKLSLDKALAGLGQIKVKHYEEEWDVLEIVRDLLRCIEPEVRVEVQTETVTRNVVPSGLKSAIRAFVSAIKEYLDE